MVTRNISLGLDDLLLKSLVGLEGALEDRDGEAAHDLARGQVHVVRHGRDLEIDSDECEITVYHCLDA
jgi:hypothetical protein